MNTKNTTAIATTDQNTCYLTETVNLAELFSEELDGLRPSFERIKIPAGGGLAYEVPGDDPNSPDSAKDFSAVILYHHPINSYYKEKFTGGNNPPDCSSLDGKLGIVAETGECKECKTCPYAKFGSGENGGMACKQKRRMYLLREGEMLPMIMTLPTGSLAEFTKYVTRLVTRGMKANHVVTKFTLKRAQNSTGINYSQVICSVDRPLSPEEKKNIASMTEQVKLIAGGVWVAGTVSAAGGGDGGREGRYPLHKEPPCGDERASRKAHRRVHGHSCRKRPRLRDGKSISYEAGRRGERDSSAG